MPKKYETEERWEDTVPAELIPAVEHLRKSFDDAHWGFGRTSQRYGYAVLHKKEIDDPTKEYFNYLMHMKARVGVAATGRFHEFVRQGTPSSMFKGFFDLYIDGVTIEISLIFEELAEIGRANRKRLAVGHLEWAEAQTKHLIRSKIHLIPIWVRDVCDKQVYNPHADVDEQIYWTSWRAPTFLIMVPSRYQPYDAGRAWDRADAETSSRWLESFTEHYVLRLESQVRKAAGEAAIELAKKPDPVDSEEPKGSAAPSVASPAAPGRSGSGTGRRELRQLETQQRYKRWQKEYRELKKRRPDMSDVWYSKQIARLPIGEGHNADTIRKHMTK